MHLPFRVNWEHRCYECECPLDISVTINGDSYEMIDIFFTHLFSWSCINHKGFYYNLSMFKYYGGIPVRRVCRYCYYKPQRINVCKRETGCYAVKKSRKSWSLSEMYKWFDDFERFRKRKDLHEYLPTQLRNVPGVKYIIELCQPI